MISGDINANTDDLETLTYMLNSDGWTDVGAQAHRWGARRSEPTCWAPNSGLMGTRRDYIFVNMQLLPFVVGFGVCPLDEMPTHAMLHRTWQLQPCQALDLLHRDAQLPDARAQLDQAVDDGRSVLRLLHSQC